MDGFREGGSEEGPTDGPGAGPMQRARADGLGGPEGVAPNPAAGAGTSDGGLAGEAARLAKNWELRARTPHRDFFVASHPGWDQPGEWARQAEVDVQLFLHGLEPDQLAGWQVLEIGCGVGRLVPSLAPRVAGYTGFDLAPGMVEVAEERNAGVANARFYLSDGTGVPTAAQDRKYDLVLALAVFIHCPRAVIAANLRSAYAQLAPGGQLRFQLRADPSDPEGLQSMDLSAALHDEIVAQASAQASGHGTAEPAPAELTAEGEYMGDCFTFAELPAWLRDAVGAPEAHVERIRFDLASHYGWLQKPG